MAALVICDGGRPLRPERWSVWRHGTWRYTVTAVGADGSPLPGAEITIRPASEPLYLSWYALRAGPGKLCIDGREYARRRRARRRRAA